MTKECEEKPTYVVNGEIAQYMIENRNDICRIEPAEDGKGWNVYHTKVNTQSTLGKEYNVTVGTGRKVRIVVEVD